MEIKGAIKVLKKEGFKVGNALVASSCGSCGNKTTLGIEQQPTFSKLFNQQQQSPLCEKCIIKVAKFKGVSIPLLEDC